MSFNFVDIRWSRNEFSSDLAKMLLDVAAGRFFSPNLCGILNSE